VDNKSVVQDCVWFISIYFALSSLNYFYTLVCMVVCVSVCRCYIYIICSYNFQLLTDVCGTCLGCRCYAGELKAAALASLTHTLSELVLTSSKFLNQFLDSQGLQAIDNLSLRVFYGNLGGMANSPHSQGGHDPHRLEIITCCLQLASHLARQVTINTSSCFTKT
jgi:hypothetical protein